MELNRVSRVHVISRPYPPPTACFFRVRVTVVGSDSIRGISKTDRLNYEIKKINDGFHSSSKGFPNLLIAIV